MPEIQIDLSRCTGCGQCVDFCPFEVLELVRANGHENRMIARSARQERCSMCDTCVGQCPAGAIRVVETEAEVEELDQKLVTRVAPISDDERLRYEEWHEILSDILSLRWNPVAVSLIEADAPMPDAPPPPAKLRHCQSIMAARRGYSLLMTPRCHACPDGTHILGMTEIPPKLASGELYLRFGKLDSVDAARQMVKERPHLPGHSIGATLVAPLKDAIHTPDVIIIAANPEQMMWLCMAASYYSGQRFDFKVSGYNALCVEATVIPFTTGKINISLGCYGCRGASDISDDLMFMGIPLAEMPRIIRGLGELGKKAIPDSRAKIYLPL
ncbi:MAG: DUF169 domain-containing protein [Syntrophorhabdales bacterium]|jgi:uncharacterized protein (DUF169 family)/NAD-dependent dihydropyrimidine dehydrogenase PreA subunit